MKLKKLIIMVVCCVIIASMGIALTGCGDSDDGKNGKYADSPYVGTWMADYQEYNGIQYPVAGLCAFTFNADGTSSLEDVSNTVESVWEPTEGGLKITDFEGDSYLTYTDGKLKMDVEHEKGTVALYFYKDE